MSDETITNNEKNNMYFSEKSVNTSSKESIFGIFLGDKNKREIEKNIKRIESLEIKIGKFKDTEKKEKIYFIGKLIDACKKQEKFETDQKQKMFYRYKRLELTKELKELTKNYRTSKKELKIPTKVSLNIKEIATSINIFFNEKDVITKVKNVCRDTFGGSASSFALIGSIGLAARLFFGINFSLSMFSSALPVVAYLGLSSIIRNLGTQTPFEKYQYYQSEEYKEYLSKFKSDNKEILEELDKLLNEKKAMVGSEDKLQMNEALIKKLDEVCLLIKDEALRNAYELQALGFCRENKKMCQKVIDNYLDEKSNDFNKYIGYHKMLAKINLDIFKRENSFKEALVHAGKGVVADSAVMILAKSIFTVVAPHTGFAIKGLQSFTIPIAFFLINGIVNIPTYSGKLKYKETSENTKIEPKEKEKFDLLFKKKKLQMS